MKKTNLSIPHTEIRMTPEEKRRTWGTISARTFEIETEIPVRKPILSRLYYGRLAPIIGYRVLFLKKRKYALSTIVVVLVTFVSLSTFAKDALPGEKLYAVKRGVNEQIELSLALTPQSKALVEAKLATTRLEEIEMLAIEEKLNVALVEKTNEAFNAHVGNLAVHLNKLESKSEFDKVAKVGVFFQTRVAVHAAVLKDMQINQKISTVSGVMSGDVVKDSNLHAITDLEQKVLTTAVPVILVTKKALRATSTQVEKSNDTKNDKQVANQKHISLDIDSNEAKAYLEGLHKSIGTPSSIMGTPLPSVVPSFVP